MLITIIAWIVLGAIAGWIAGMLVRGDERWGVLGHIVLGIVGALVGGFLANALGFGSGREGGDVVNIQSIIVAIIGAVIVVLVVVVVAATTSVAGTVAVTGDAALSVSITVKPYEPGTAAAVVAIVSVDVVTVPWAL